MGKFDGVLLVSDYDDTFLGTNHAVSPRNYEALNYYLAQGGLFTIATGRAHRTFAPHVHLAPVNAPVGPKNRKLPTGRRGSPSPMRLRRTALATASTARSWPMV